MKNLILISIALFGLFFISCSDGNNEKVVVDPNVSDSKLENKSGGVYFVSSLAGEYIFRLNLKNGDNAMTCEMFHEDSYSELVSAETTWEPGEALDNLQFSAGEVKLMLSLNEDGKGETQIFVGGKEFESVIFKSTAKEPVKIYSGLEVVEVFDVGELHIRRDAFVMIIIEGKYFTGMKMEGDSFYRYTPEPTAFISISATDLIFLQPDILEFIDEWSWERQASYNEDRIYCYEYEDLDNGNYYKSELTLYRRFKQ